MKLRILRPWGPYGPGAIVDVRAELAAALRAKGVAEAVAGPEAAVLPPAPEKAVRRKAPRRRSEC